LYQQVNLVGRLGKDPEVRYTRDGSAVASFSVATSERWRDKQSGEQKERTEWHNITAFQRLAEICSEYLKKGSLVMIVGKLQTDKYEKDGITRYSTKIIAREMKMLGDTRGAGGGSESSGGNRPPVSQEQEPGGFEDDIPF
jgi:single-strand DNA-binding protein